MDIHDYLIDQAGIDWAEGLSGWAWLLPPDVEVWLVSRFGDLFLVFPGGTVHLLDIATGALDKVGESREDFCRRIDEGNNAAEWLMIPLVDRLVGAGVTLGPGQCYGFVTPPVLGGAYAVENVRPISLADYVGWGGSLHEQIREVPDGRRVVIRRKELPGLRPES